jgi:hypothetical protein
MKGLAESLKSVKIGEVKSYRGMTIVPLIGSNYGYPKYATLDEAMKEDLITISELSEGGTVPELKVITKNRDVLLLDGETLEGAKQNRTLNLSILVPANTTLNIPVSCVEQGRWSRRTETFRAANHNMMPTARSRRMDDVTDSMKNSGSRRSNQMGVWGEIDEKLDQMGISAPTRDMSAMFEAHSVNIDKYVEVFSPLSDQVGAIFVIDGMIQGLEFFHFSHTLQNLLPKLLRSYGIDAIESEGVEQRSISQSEITKFIEQVISAESTLHKAIGIGEDIRLSNQHVTAAALVADGQIIHLAAFQRHQPAQRSSSKKEM